MPMASFCWSWVQISPADILLIYRCSPVSYSHQSRYDQGFRHIAFDHDVVVLVVLVAVSDDQVVLVAAMVAAMVAAVELVERIEQ